MATLYNNVYEIGYTEAQANLVMQSNTEYTVSFTTDSTTIPGFGFLNSEDYDNVMWSLGSNNQFEGIILDTYNENVGEIVYFNNNPITLPTNIGESVSGTLIEINLTSPTINPSEPIAS